jgi:putative PIN family toxin of toxin-antitoxin system
MLVVLDTNVILSGLRSRRGASFRVLTALRRSEFEIAISVPLVLEYEAVLRRQAESLGLTGDDVGEIVDFLCSIARRQDIHFLWRPMLRDPRDEFLLEVAVAARCDAIVTHNMRDFSGAKAFGVEVISPGTFISRHFRGGDEQS